MKNKVLKHITHLVFIFLSTSSIAIASDDFWYSSISFDATYGTYSETEADQFNTNSSISLLYDLSYLERFGLALKATQSLFTYNDNSPNLSENKFALLIHNNSSFDLLKGTINSSLATFSVSGINSISTFAVSPEFYYLNNSQTFLFGGGYAYSSYGGQGNSKTNINQYTASLGFTPYFKNVWITSKSYYIENKNQTNIAHSIKLNVKTTQTSRVLPKNYLIGILTGTRQYAVEQDTLLIYNTEDKQTGSFFVSANWNIMDNGYIAITIGREEYASLSTMKKYNYNFINASTFISWR